MSKIKLHTKFRSRNSEDKCEVKLKPLPKKTFIFILLTTPRVCGYRSIESEKANFLIIYWSKNVCTLLASRKNELFSLLISHSLDRTRCSCTFWNLIFRRFNDFSLVIVWAPFGLLLFKKVDRHQHNSEKISGNRTGNYISLWKESFSLFSFIIIWIRQLCWATLTATCIVSRTKTRGYSIIGSIICIFFSKLATC